MSTGNFGPLCKDAFSQNIHIKGAMVIDKNQNITGNGITCQTLRVNGNAHLGNIVSNNLIVANVINAQLFVGPLSGPVYDEMGAQILDLQQPAIANPNTVPSFLPGSNVNDTIVPQYPMPALGNVTIPMSSEIEQNSVEHLLYYNHIQLRNQVENLQTQVIELLQALRNHGIINS